LLVIKKLIPLLFLHSWTSEESTEYLIMHRNKSVHISKNLVFEARDLPAEVSRAGWLAWSLMLSPLWTWCCLVLRMMEHHQGSVQDWGWGMPASSLFPSFSIYFLHLLA
jgi:hypothetical protein